MSKNFKFTIIFLALVLIIGGLGLYFNFCLNPLSHIHSPITTPSSEAVGFQSFLSDEEFKEYLSQATQISKIGDYGFNESLLGSKSISSQEALLPTSNATWKTDDIGRISETTVQTSGIDEPDIIKTDGKEIYFSLTEKYYPWIMMEESSVVSNNEIIKEESLDEGVSNAGTSGRNEPTGEEMPIPKLETKIIKAFPFTELAVDSKIEKSGDLLLFKNILVILSSDQIYGFDVSNPKSPKEIWNIKLENQNQYENARLYNGKIYLVTKTQIDFSSPCPVKPLSLNGSSIEIRCVDIYHPEVLVPADVIYNIIVLNPQSGEIENKTSFVGSSGTSVIYMSKDNLFISFSSAGDFVDFTYNFFEERGKDLIPSDLLQKIQDLKKYDISKQAKLTEISVIIENYKNSLSSNEKMKFENEITNRMNDYYKAHRREIEKSTIAKINLDNLKVVSTGEVPGSPLNQFSLDEFDGYLRIATTLGGRFGFGWWVNGESSNDLYILDKDLEVIGDRKDLGKGERIYSARFIEDRGYVVTFKETDPFFVFDLSNPQNPKLAGELKIPGYSSYLHPIEKNKILGIGKEGDNVKISLFDVFDPQNPKEISKYTLEEYFSDILETHHAFLLDDKHKIFFLPGSRGGYVFSYLDDKLELKKTIADIMAKRAIYINDYLYIVGEDKIVVLNEADWQELKELEFR